MTKLTVDAIALLYMNKFFYNFPILEYVHFSSQKEFVIMLLVTYKIRQTFLTVYTTTRTAKCKLCLKKYCLLRYLIDFFSDL